LTLSHGSFVVPLLVAGGICLFGALNFMFIMGKVEPLKIDKPDAASKIATASH
ncbi:MFS transporter, partial [Winslowiella iniecta]